MKTQRIIALTTLMLALAATVHAEDPAELGLRYAKVQQAGIDQLKQYHWESSTRVTKAGETKAEITVGNRLNEKGEMVQEVETAAVDERKKRGMRGRAQEDQLAEGEAFLEHVAATTGAYIFMSKGQEVDFFDKATITDGAGKDAGRMIVTAKDVLATGDVVTKYIDPETLYPGKIVFETTVDGLAVKAEVLLRAIESGPNVPRMATVNVTADGRVIETEFLEYKKSL